MRNESTAKRWENVTFSGPLSPVYIIFNAVPYASATSGMYPIILGAITETEAILRWFIGTQAFWIILFAVGEVAAFLVIVGYLFSYKLELRPFHADSELQATDSSVTSHRPASTILMFRHIILRIVVYACITRALRHPDDESVTQSHSLGQSTQCLSTVFDTPPEETNRDANEFEKDYTLEYVL
ncbi:hypothetical protein B0H19DRAFT_1381592 [Mycena capillaripes]|nr:hypothetical protein B0H19DRAFT_1381592 [Mycena capillaripes]